MATPKSLKILFVTSEVIPFMKTGGLADVSAALPQKLMEQGHQIRIIAPKYGAIDERKHKIHEVVRLKDITTEIGKKEVIFSLRSSFLPGQKYRVQIYFLDNKDYFGSRHSLYTDPLTGKDFSDNDERFILLAKSVFYLIDKLGWVPDVIHCNDWQTGLVPYYKKVFEEENENLKKIKTLFTIHNIVLQGLFPKSTCKKIGTDVEKCQKELLHKNKISFLKAGILYADAINTVSETYAKEISEDDKLSYGLKDILKKRKKDLYGIINGIDYKIWNPEKDKLIPKKYSVKKPAGKFENRLALIKKFNMEIDDNTPIVGNISRLYDTKGFDLIKKAFNQLMKLDMKLIILGTGDKKYHDFLEDMAFKHRDKFIFYPGFDDALAHLIEAGSDIYLMPSKTEPCGLNQMYSMVYGTVPVAHATGGLIDTIEPYNPKTGKGTGFLFEEYSTKALVGKLNEAVKLFQDDKKTWQKIIKNCMSKDFSWKTSAKNYAELYRKILD